MGQQKAHETAISKTSENEMLEDVAGSRYGVSAESFTTLQDNNQIPNFPRTLGCKIFKSKPLWTPKVKTCCMSPLRLWPQASHPDP